MREPNSGSHGKKRRYERVLDPVLASEEALDAARVFLLRSCRVLAWTLVFGLPLLSRAPLEYWR